MTHTEEEMAINHIGRDWTEVTTSQGKLAATSSWKKQGKDLLWSHQREKRPAITVISTQ